MIFAKQTTQMAKGELRKNLRSPLQNNHLGCFVRCVQFPSARDYKRGISPVANIRTLCAWRMARKRAALRSSSGECEPLSRLNRREGLRSVHQKERGRCFAPTSLFLVDPRGVEPLSESPLIRLSPWAVCYLKFPICGVSRQTPRQGSHFMRDRFNGETPMHGHRSMTLGSRSRFSESNGQDRSLAALPN